MKKFLVLFLIVVSVNVAQAQKDIIGNWFTKDNNAKVQIYEQSGKYFGKIVWLKTPLDENNKPKVDNKNPDEKLRQKPIVGLNILSGFVYDGDNEWDDGEIYDPKNGKNYSCKMKLKDGKLEIRGYIGISLFGRTEIWTKAD